MSAVPGLGNANIRLVEPDEPELPPPAKIIVDTDPPEGSDVPEFDEKGNVLRITHGDGSLSISLDGHRAFREAKRLHQPPDGDPVGELLRFAVDGQLHGGSRIHQGNWRRNLTRA